MSDPIPLDQWTTIEGRAACGCYCRMNVYSVTPTTVEQVLNRYGGMFTTRNDDHDGDHMRACQMAIDPTQEEKFYLDWLEGDSPWSIGVGDGRGAL